MSGLSSWFGFGGGANSGSDEMPDLFPLNMLQTDFIRIDVMNIYAKILTDVLERTQGLKDENKALLWDNCLGNESSRGLVSLLARAMHDKSDLFLVFDKPTKVIRQATGEEAVTIRTDYKEKGISKVGTFITFAHYQRTDMLKLYSALEYCTIGSLNKSMNVSKAVQIKISELRASTAMNDSADAKTQAKSIADGLKKGRDVILDAKDEVTTAKPDVSATEAALEMLNHKRGFYLGLPQSYITGILNGGLGDSGAGDAKAVERGLKNYYVSILKPVLEQVFGAKTTFKSDDFDQITTSIEVLKTFELVSGELISEDNKRTIVNKLFGLDPDTKGDPPAADPPVDPNAPPAAPAKPFGGAQ